MLNSETGSDLAVGQVPFPSSGFRRMPTIVGHAMAATSHPLATRIAVRTLEEGGNAVDAALAAAAVLTVAEPTDCGLGGDGFAQVWFNHNLYGINGSGRAPRRFEAETVERYGRRSVTVPGVVAMWSDLAIRFGRFGLDRGLRWAIDLAEQGLPATVRIADLWSTVEHEGRAPRPAPRPGERYSFPNLGRTLRRISADGPDAFYKGETAEAIAAATWLSVEDLMSHRSEWVEPLRFRYRDVEVCELPPNTQGPAALIALGIAKEFARADLVPRLHGQIEAVKLAVADADQHIGDSALPSWLLEPDHLAKRRGLITPDHAMPAPPLSAAPGDTSYLCCIDADGNGISLIQSLYDRFGSGVVAGETGVVLHNRAWGFTSQKDHPNEFQPAKRPFHTIIPGLLLENGHLLGAFGVMGGPMQVQGHLQILQHLIDGGLDPQSALDAARFRVDGRGVLLEPGLWPIADELRRLGHDVVLADSPVPFGVGQVILNRESALVGGSDGRGDGHAAGF